DEPMAPCLQTGGSRSTSARQPRHAPLEDKGRTTLVHVWTPTTRTRGHIHGHEVSTGGHLMSTLGGWEMNLPGDVGFGGVREIAMPFDRVVQMGSEALVLASNRIDRSTQTPGDAVMLPGNVVRKGGEGAVGLH